MYILFQNYNKQEGTGKYTYNPSILDNKQLLSNMVNHKATQAFAKIFGLNYPTILD